MKKRRKLFWTVLSIILIAIVIWLIVRQKSAVSDKIEVPVSKGNFIVTVTTTGDLEARNSENISGPSSSRLREARLWELTIDDIIPDGTLVDSGQYVARLDRSELTNSIKDKEIEVETAENNLTVAQLDTALTLRSARDELLNLAYNVEETQITVDQSIYEPPATQRQANIDLDKAKRSLKQAQENYSIKLEQALVKISEVSTSLKKKQRELDNLYAVNDEFTIYAPKSGMLVYERDYNGKKRGVGSTVSIWDNVVATLPDMRSMVIKTYVNEIDISKVEVGQQVQIGVDAFPQNKYTGSVYQVANIGEQMTNSNSKVFEVMIQVNEYDSILRPAMTTKNSIVTDQIENVLYIPLEAIHGTDSLEYVFSGGVRKQVIAGQSNDNEIVILEGLSEGDLVWLTQPENQDDYRLVPLSPETIMKYEAQRKAATVESHDSIPNKASFEGQRREGSRGMRPEGGKRPQRPH